MHRENLPLPRRAAAAGWSLAALALLLFSCSPAGAALTYTIGGSWPNAAHQAAADAAMQAVVGRYNDFGDFGNYDVYVYYNAGIPTAQASYGGSIGFGGTYPNQRVTAHELAHYLGLPSGAWNSLMTGGTWDGPLGLAKVKQFDGEQATLNGDSIHFWPYGLNFDSEGGTTNLERQVAVVYAMRGDLGIGPSAHPSNPSRGVALTADNPTGQSGFNYKGQWSDGYFAHAGTDYFTSDYKLRTPASSSDFRFYGDSLTVSNTNGANGGLIYNGQGGAVIVDDLRLSGGWVQHQASLANPLRLEGAVDVRADSAFRAKQGDIDLYADLSGDDALTIETTDSPGTDARYVRFHTAGSTFHGDLINKARFELAAGAAFNFRIAGGGVSNSISGPNAYATKLNGVFNLDLASASANAGDAWSLVTAANTSYGESFAVTGFTGHAGVWSDGGYSFSQASGLLSVVPGWAIDGGGAWSSAASWSAGVPTAGGEATFGPALTAAGAPANVMVDAPVSVSRITFDNANAYQLSGGSTITLTGGALLHAKAGDHEIAAPITGSDGLTMIGPGSVTLSAANPYTGDTDIRSGALRLAAGGSIAGSDSIQVHAGATLDAAAAGGVSVGAGQTLAGAGQVLGGAAVQGGGVLRVGGAGLPSATSVGGFDKIDDFQQYAPGKLNAGATDGVWTGVFDGTANAQVVSDDGGEQSIEFYGIGNDWRGARTSLSNSFDGDYSLANGDSATYFFRVQRQGSQALDGVFGLTDLDSIGTSDPTQELAVTLAFTKGASSRAPNQLVAHDGATGQDVLLLTNVATDEWVNVWLVVDNQNKTFRVATSTGANEGELAETVFDFGQRTAAGAALDTFAGAELLAGSNPAAASIRIDDLYRLPADSLANPIGLAGETFTIDGDLTLLSDAALELDIASGSAHDRLAISGAAQLGGALRVNLHEDFTLAEGDAFDLLDFASATGAFDQHDLPTLAAGLRWDLDGLTTDGSIAVALGQAGDFNADGVVDAADYTVWRDRQGAAEDAATLAGNGTADGVVDGADYDLWRTNFGAVLSASAGQAAVPEPLAATLLAAMLATVGVGRQRRGTRQ